MAAAKRKTRKKKPAKGQGNLFLKILFFPIQLLLAIVLPFVVLVRVSTLSYIWTDWSGWLCLGIGAIFTFFLIFLYLNRIARWFSGRRSKKKEQRSRRQNLRLAIVVVGGFVAYALFFLSGQNAKTTEVQGEFQTVHPLLRTAVGAILLFHRDAIITDMSRVPEDYGGMGLAPKQRSLHYPQSDGYVHAVDFRTQGNAEWRNELLKWTFEALGFRTLRHVGSADHLHISLLARDNPGAL